MEVVLAYGIASAPSAGGHVVVIDVLRAFTCAAFALARGAESIVLVSTTDEAQAVKRARPDVLLMGEVGGRIIPGFDFGNSPWELNRQGDLLRGRTLVQRTGSGTQGVVSAKAADAVYLGSLPVASATCRRLRAIGAKTATLLAMGSPSGSDGPEDLACRALMADVLAGRHPDHATAIREVRESLGGQRALDPAIDWTVPGDLDCATDVDRFDFAMPVLREDGLIVARRLDVARATAGPIRPVQHILARRALDDLSYDELPAAALVLVEHGYVTDELCSLIGVRDFPPLLARERFETSLRRLGLGMSVPAAIVVRSVEWAHAILDGAVRPEKGAYEIGAFWRLRDLNLGELPAERSDDWRDFYADWAEYGCFPARDPEIEAEIRERAKEFVRRYG